MSWSLICADAGVMQQVDEALAAEDELRLNRDLQKEMTAIQDDIKSVTCYLCFDITRLYVSILSLAGS